MKLADSTQLFGLYLGGKFSNTFKTLNIPYKVYAKN